MLKLMMFSNTATTVDSAAKLMNRKNSVPHSCPTGIWLNTLGSVMNTRPGPLPGSTPNAKHAGKMMRPDTVKNAWPIAANTASTNVPHPPSNSFAKSGMR